MNSVLERGTDEIVGRFARDGHLVAMPAREAKRRLVLEHIAQSFEPGVYYPEREVDAILRAWTDGGPSDHATLRRYLVDDGLLATAGTGVRAAGSTCSITEQ